jgi:bacteriocin-like protein
MPQLSATAPKTRELTEAELAAVTGGKVNVRDMQVTYKISDGTSNTLLIGE